MRLRSTIFNEHIVVIGSECIFHFHLITVLTAIDFCLVASISFSSWQVAQVVWAPGIPRSEIEPLFGPSSKQQLEVYRASLFATDFSTIVSAGSKGLSDAVAFPASWSCCKLCFAPGLTQLSVPQQIRAAPSYWYIVFSKFKEMIVPLS